MAPIRNARVLMNEYPIRYPVSGKTTVYDDSQTIDLENVPLSGGFILKTLVLSIDPYLRILMAPGAGDSNISGFDLGKPLTSFGVGVVVRSESGDVKVGDHVYGLLIHEEYSVRSTLADLVILEEKHGLPWSAYVGPAGMPGQTAYIGWKEFAHPKAGDTIFVSTGGGSVGSLVIQFAKMDGLKVIASAGSDEKVAFMKELGADVAFNYKTTSTAGVLNQEGPIDIFWDNVGGETLEAALDAARTGARFIECGMISGYNQDGVPVRNLMQVVTKEITLKGFNFNSSLPKYLREFYDTIPLKLAKGEMKYKEEVAYGLDKVGDVILGVLKGINKAKAVIHVADD